jgi:hypothetical protein
MQDYVLKVRAKTANEDVSAALERLGEELNRRTEDAAVLAVRLSRLNMPLLRGNTPCMHVNPCVCGLWCHM